MKLPLDHHGEGCLQLMIKIGITTQIEQSKNREENAINMDYIRAVINAGGLPILIPVTLDFGMLNDYLKLVDGILFTGGGDINPLLYNEQNEGLCEEMCFERDQMEMYLLKKAIEESIPVLGICRGHQLINVYFGGSLYQDLMTQYHTEIDHINIESEADFIAHSVKLESTSRIKQWYGESKIQVNSRHHQAIKRLGEGLIITGRSKDGIVEAIEHTSHNVVGVQWHPEDLASYCTKLFVAFFDQCRKG